MSGIGSALYFLVSISSDIECGEMWGSKRLGVPMTNFALYYFLLLSASYTQSTNKKLSTLIYMSPSL